MPSGSLRGPLGTLLLGSAGLLAVHLRDPHRYGSWGLCPIKLLTGWDCPGCGGLRALDDLGNGHLDAAWHSNALLVLSLPFLVVGWLLWTRRAAQDRPVRLRPRTVALAGAAYLLVVLGFAVWRNSPWGQAFHVS